MHIKTEALAHSRCLVSGSCVWGGGNDTQWKGLGRGLAAHLDSRNDHPSLELLGL